ncbi:MAG: Holliday junction resolvase RuvX [Candidatus Aegiribacteria sp.]|nr:Holliday junction resolvase RuvX [Candidatus Aegiribacteria sp.]MBD3295730.1 Holliday junction resolvase RuvX [Candidatus Fermentibacteria bacterium]
MVTVAVDYGRERTGFAIYLSGTVVPLEPLTGSTWNGISNRLKKIGEEQGKGTVVLGLPLTAGGKHTELSREVEGLAHYLKKEGFSVELVRETGTTAESVQYMDLKRERNGRSDSLAAMVILKRYVGMA